VVFVADITLPQESRATSNGAFALNLNVVLYGSQIATNLPVERIGFQAWPKTERSFVQSIALDSTVLCLATISLYVDALACCKRGNRPQFPQKAS
jgi:hypothetical protein